MDNNLKRRYQLKLFITATVAIWLVVALFTWVQYRQEKAMRVDMVVSRMSLAVGNIIDAHAKNRDIQSYLTFINRYLTESLLDDMSMAVYNAHTGALLYSIGEVRDWTHPRSAEKQRFTYHDGSRVVRLIDPNTTTGEHIFLYSSRVSPDGNIEVRTFLPYNAEVIRAVSISPLFWWLVLGVGVIGTILAYIITAHQARSVTLLHDFARRAAEDRDFIPMGNFPSDELGDISRQIVAIYNSRSQANQRREREHMIARKATEERDKLKRTMTNNISHELKTPVGIVRSYLDMVLSQADMPEADRTHFLRKAQENVERLVSMLNDLSTVTRLDEAKGKIPMKDIDFEALTQSIAEEAVAGGLTGDMDLEVKVDPGCHILGNEGLLRSALMNLIRNARNYSQGTQMGLRQIGRNDTYYSFSFYDNGVGVAQEHIPHLFDRFYRIDAGRSRKVGGTGLGLPIVKSSITSMGGTISIRTRKGGGLEFLFTLARISNDDIKRRVSVNRGEKIDTAEGSAAGEAEGDTPITPAEGAGA